MLRITRVGSCVEQRLESVQFFLVLGTKSNLVPSLNESDHRSQ